MNATEKTVCFSGHRILHDPKETVTQQLENAIRNCVEDGKTTLMKKLNKMRIRLSNQIGNSLRFGTILVQLQRMMLPYHLSRLKKYLGVLCLSRRGHIALGGRTRIHK